MVALRKFIQPNLYSNIRNICTTSSLRSHELVVHRDNPDNNEGTHFEFTADNVTRIEAMINNYPKGSARSALGAALDLAQRQIGWVPISAMHKVAKMLNIPRIRVYEWATFYTMNKRQYRGKYNVKVCKTTPCMLRGADIIIRAVEESCCCRVGEVSPDYMFGVDVVECQGACANAPVMVIDDDYFEDLTLCDVPRIIGCLKSGHIPTPGPQNGRFAAEPICGLTTLWQQPPGPGFMLQPALYSC